MKRKRSSSSPSSFRRKSEIEETIFASILAAVSCNRHPYAQLVLRKRLKQVRQSLVSENPQPLPSSIIALLPALMDNKSGKIAPCAAEIVGLASLLSFDMNVMIVTDGEIVRGLIRGAVDGRRSVALAACNAVLDMSTTEIGRRQLLEFSAVETFMFGFCQVMKLPKVAVDSCNGGNVTCNGVSIMFVGDELQKVIFDIVVTLINSCNREQLEMIQSELSKNVLVYLREIWRKVCLNKNSGDCSDLKIERLGYLSSMKRSSLAEIIFRLSMSVGEYLTYPLDQVSRSVFGISECSFQNFILDHWEESNFVLRSSESLRGKENIFGPFLRLLNCEEAISSFLSDCLPRMQDIRLVRTDNQIETHFLPKVSGGFIKYPDVLNFNDILECEEGYRQGYTIALRGLEFRFELIAAVADSIAFMFGQPSVGANLYLTPSNSQGLARHYDDHCVFVCQLVGEKQWTMLEQPTIKLPRLYEPLKNVCRSHVKSVSEETNCLLKEGDFLYIPRGLAHEACTITRDGELDALNRFSMHLTFGIEVEPPFE